MKNHWPKGTYRTYFLPAGEVENLRPAPPIFFDPSILEFAKKGTPTKTNWPAYMAGRYPAQLVEAPGPQVPVPTQGESPIIPAPSDIKPGHYVNTPYLQNFLSPSRLWKTAKDAAAIVNLLGVDAIACRGNSGTLIAGPVSMISGVPILLVRKQGESNHSGLAVEGIEGPDLKNYVIVDDFIATGKTFEEIVRALREHRSQMRCIGCIETNQANFSLERIQHFHNLAAEIDHRLYIWPAETSREDFAYAENYLVKQSEKLKPMV
jgi:adenine/guanine phosphoribosyltransferase-like PRPP-binding protein